MQKGTLVIRCNMCMSDWEDSDYVHLCSVCDTDDYLMEVSYVD